MKRCILIDYQFDCDEENCTIAKCIRVQRRHKVLTDIYGREVTINEK